MRYIEELESRRLMSAGTVSVPLRGAAEGNLSGNVITIVGHASELGKFTASFNAQGLLVLTAANGDELWASTGALVPTSDPTIWHVDGSYVGGTGRFVGASGTFSHDIQFVDAQGDFVYSIETRITLQRPWNDKT
jgi:hypothetical protein